MIWITVELLIKFNKIKMSTKRVQDQIIKYIQQKLFFNKFPFTVLLYRC